MANKKIIITAAVSALVSCLLTNTVRDIIDVQTGGMTLKKTATVTRLLHKYYLNGVDDSEIADAAATAITDELGDPYTKYFDSTTFAKYMEDATGKYVGIGVVLSIDKDNKTIQIVSPYEGSPGEEAGLLPGDIIEKIDGREYDADNYDEAVNTIKGQEGESVTLTIRRGSTSFDVTLVRRLIQRKAVKSKMLGDSIGYIRITDFDTDVDKEFSEHLSDLENQGMQRLIIDLRNNPGGDFNAVCKIADKLLPEGIITYTEDKNGKRINKRSDAQELDMPIAVLINEGSASASEVLSGALKSHHKAVLVGKKTYGKGVVQKLIPFSDGSGIKITQSKYYLPSGECINGIGIQPDIDVDLPDGTNKSVAQLSETEDTQLARAIEVIRQYDKYMGE
ncbi:MAG: S41 family peptidase [Clostridia bacterium]|nr:S41 family peptidase [Clostridia bacterium]